MRNALFETEPDRPPTPQETAILRDLRDRQRKNWLLTLVGIPVLVGLCYVLPEVGTAVLVGLAIVAGIGVRAISSRAQCPRCGERFYAGWGYLEQACGHCGLSLRR